MGDIIQWGGARWKVKTGYQSGGGEIVLTLKREGGKREDRGAIRCEQFHFLRRGRAPRVWIEFAGGVF